MKNFFILNLVAKVVIFSIMSNIKQLNIVLLNFLWIISGILTIFASYNQKNILNYVEFNFVTLW